MRGITVNTVESRNQGTEPMTNIPSPGRMRFHPLMNGFQVDIHKEKIRTVSVKP